ncbi:MAG: polysaccharide deacetylase family protein [Candidatus Omnitrophica bacterium]|nr:polysaccharide deacetylase family protein [Candidatus Omnitrophota bacterium]
MQQFRNTKTFIKKRLGIFCLVIGILTAGSFGFYFFFQVNYYPPILTYHHINEQETPLSVSLENFIRQMDFIKRHNYQVISFEDLCLLLKKKEKLPHNLVVITFDDGNFDNLFAARILKKYDFPATFFIVINWINKRGFLTRKDLTWIEKNSRISFGSHTLKHSYLPSLSGAQLSEAIIGSKRKAKEIFGLELNSLAYPIGGFNEETLRIVKRAGYLCACTTNRGFSRELDLYALKRIRVNNRDLGFRLWAKLSGFYDLLRRLKKPY